MYVAEEKKTRSWRVSANGDSRVPRLRPHQASLALSARR